MVELAGLSGSFWIFSFTKAWIFLKGPSYLWGRSGMRLNIFLLLSMLEASRASGFYEVTMPTVYPHGYWISTIIYLLRVVSCAEYSVCIISFMPPNKQIALLVTVYRCVIWGLERIVHPRTGTFTGNKRQSWDLNPGLAAIASAVRHHAMLLLPPGHDFIMWRVGPVMHDHKIAGKWSWL